MWDDEDVRIDRRASALSLHAFVRRAWCVADPVVATFVDGHHVRVICEELQTVSDGRVGRLAVNVPPGHGKSMLISVLWPAWEWATRDPRLRYVVWTHSAHLARRDAERVANLCASDWYRARWPEVRVAEHEPTLFFHTSAGGYRFSTTVGGLLTGEHADRFLVDDPNAADASAAELADTEERYRTKTGTRGQPGHARVLVMQRLAQHDLSDYVVRQGWRHVRLPARAEGADSPCPVDEPHDCRRDGRRTGDLLWPERYPDGELAAQELILGPAGAAAQLQQRPAPTGGAVFRADWLGHEWRGPLRLERLEALLQSWDCAFKGSDGSDWVVGVVVGWLDAKAYLLDLVRGRWGFVDTCAQVRLLSARYPLAVTKLVEDAANGAAVCDALDNELPGLQLVRPEGGKLARAHATTGLWAAGDVLLPPDDWRGPRGDAPPAREWKSAFRLEHLAFRGSPTDVDDQVDAVSQALNYLRENVGWITGMGRLAQAP